MNSFFAFRSLPEDGFSLLEVMITLAVLAIVAGLAAPALLQMAPNMALKSAARDLYSRLYEAKILAIKNNSRISVRFDSGNSFYYIDSDGSGSYTPAATDTFTDANGAHFKYGRTISGRGIYIKPKSDVDPETGKMDPDSTEAHACTIAEVEVDTETGEVTVLSLKSAYDVGRQVNPALVEGQIRGGSFMGMEHALYETTHPYYPEGRSHAGQFQRVRTAWSNGTANHREHRVRISLGEWTMVSKV